MAGVLESVEWSKPIQRLLSRCDGLDGKLRTVMHIRHTERQDFDDIRKRRTAMATPLGRKAAYEVGLRLHVDRSYRFFHTFYERTRETAQLIHEGLVERGVVSDVAGEMGSSMILDQEAYYKYAADNADSIRGASDFVEKWISGSIPADIVLPSKMFAQRLAETTVSNLLSTGERSFHIYVSHDVWVAAVMHHWFNVEPDVYVAPLDGFIVQLAGSEMNVFLKDREMTLDYPEWWKNI